MEGRVDLGCSFPRTQPHRHERRFWDRPGKGAPYCRSWGKKKWGKQAGSNLFFHHGEKVPFSLTRSSMGLLN